MSAPVTLVGLAWTMDRVRAWAFDEEGEILSRVVDDAAPGQPGKGADTAKAFVANWLGGPIGAPMILCGDTGSGTGRLLQVPTLLDALSDALVRSDEVYLVPGLKQLSPADLLCGQETLLVGLGQMSGAVCVPGFHTKHVSLEQGRVLGFSTEMTGEIISLLESEGSLKLGKAVHQTFEPRVFRDWVERSLDTEDAASPFAVSAARSIGVLRAEHQAAALSGLMIGADIAAHYDPGDDVILVADGPMAEAYGMALDALGASVEEYSAEEAMQDGLFEIAEAAGLLEQ